MTNTTIGSGLVSLSPSTYLNSPSASAVYSAIFNTPTLTHAGTLISGGNNSAVTFLAAAL